MQLVKSISALSLASLLSLPALGWAQDDPDISEGDLVDENGEYVISQEDWIKVQIYSNNALALPVTESSLRLQLQRDEDESFEDFLPLLSAYQTAQTNALDWEQNIFPASVDLSVDIGNYADKAAVYYQPLSDAISAVIADPDDASSAALVQALIADLSSDASEYATNAAAVESDINDFATLIATDHSQLETLSTSYAESHGAESEDWELLKTQMEQKEALLDQIQDEYNHNVTVAATTPTYAWIYPYGTVCAVVVAGVYGDRAVKALNQIHELQDEIEALGDEIAKAERLRASLDYATTGASNMADAVADALPVIQTIRGQWQSMQGDLENIADNFGDMETAIPLLQNLQVSLQLNEWDEVGEMAEGYVLNAYISVIDGE